MRIGSAILSSVFVAATGYMVFSRPARGPIGVWDAAFVLCIAGFLVCVLRLIVRVASAHVSHRPGKRPAGKGTELRGAGGRSLGTRAHQDPDEPHGA